MSYGRRNYRSGPARPARWMPLKYAGTCKVCARAIPAGETAFYDPAGKSTTCHDMACAKADGLTQQVWHGSPVSGRWVDALSERRTGSGHRSEVIRDPGEDMADRWNETRLGPTGRSRTVGPRRMAPQP